MSASAPTARALWFVWDGSEDAVLGRNDGRPIEVTSRGPECDIFVVKALTSTGEASDLLDFFWVRRQRAFLRPLVLPRDAEGVEVAILLGGRPVPLARYHLDHGQQRDQMACDIVSAQLRRDEFDSGQPSFVRSQPATFADAEGRLAPLQQNRAHTLIWAVAAPFEDVGQSGGLLERRVGPLSTLFPRKADLIKVAPVPYRKEREETDDSINDDDERDSGRGEPAIKAVARELRYVIALEVDAPLTEVSDANAVPGLVIFHYMKQRELIQLWQDTTRLLRFTVTDLEVLEQTTYPFAPSGTSFVVRPLHAHEDLIEGISVSASDQRSGNGLVRRFTINFAFAILGDLVVVCDMVTHRLIGPDGAGCPYLTFRVGPEKLEYLDLDPRSDDRMIAQAHAVMESGYEALRHPDVDDPSQVLIDFLAAQGRVTGLDTDDLARRPLLPLFTIAYAAHARRATAEAAEQIKHPAFLRDPSVQSAAFLTPALASAQPARPYGAAPRFFSMRLAAQLGALDLIMPPVAVAADIQAVDLLTNQRNRGMWDDASTVGVRVDIGRTDIPMLAVQLRDFRGWRDNPDIMDEVIHSTDQAVSQAFRAFLEDKQPYQRPLAASDFDRLYAMVQPIAIEVERAATAKAGSWSSGPAPQHDLRTTEELRSDLAKLLDEGQAHADPKVRNIAKRHAEANYVLRKQMREAEKALKDVIGSPAISKEILALIDRLETWAAIDGAARPGAQGPDDRRQRILDLARAFRTQPPEISRESHLGRDIESITKRVDDECSRFRPDAAPEDNDILSVLPSYAGLLGLSVARRALAAARGEGHDLPDTATRLFLLWPERAADCWEKHERWASNQGAAVRAHLTKPWSVEI